MTNKGSDELWDAMEVLRHRPVVLESRRYVEKQQRVRTLTRRTLLLAGSVTVGALIATQSSWLLGQSGTSYKTALGEVKSVLLDDGSTVTLNTESEIFFEASSNRRTVKLVRGQAHFDVAKDASKPFVVAINQREVTAIGTAFDISRAAKDIVITLIEGTISVRPDEAAEAIQLELPGEQVAIEPNGQLAKNTVRFENVTAWRVGKIYLDDIALEQALAEINRYSSTKIKVLDQALQVSKISGILRAGDTSSAVDLLTRYFNLVATKPSEDIIILTKKI